MTELVADMLPPGRSAAVIEMIEARLQRLAVAPEVEAEAVGIVKAAGVPGLDQAKLFAEWRSDVLASDGDDFKVACEDPPGIYLEWLRARVKDPFHVTFRAVSQYSKNRDLNGANEFVYVRWPQEVAWAHRLRASGDDRTAFFSTLFLRQAAHNTAKAFHEVAAAFDSAMREHSFALADEHKLTAKAIRLGVGEVTHRPAFLRLYEVKHATTVDRMSPTEMAALALRARESQAVDRNRVYGATACALAQLTPISRLIGVIHVARETLRDSDQLVLEERTFLESVAKGEIALLSGGIPNLEFIHWLRARAPVDVLAPHDEDPNLAKVLGSPGRWVAGLPRDYHDYGAGDQRKLASWLTPIITKQRPVPLDCVVDFGFHLIATA